MLSMSVDPVQFVFFPTLLNMMPTKANGREAKNNAKTAIPASAIWDLYGSNKVAALATAPSRGPFANASDPPTDELAAFAASLMIDETPMTFV